MRWQEGSPTEGVFSQPAPGTYWQGWELGQNGLPAFLSLVNTRKSSLFYRKHQCWPLGPTSSSRSGPQQPAARC